VNARKGYILTNNHVIAKASKITVILNDGRRFNARIIGRDQKSDVAVIKIKAPNLTEVKFGDSEKLQVGDFVVAIGNPFGIGQSATSGIVSATGRSGLTRNGYEDFIQTDAAINKGNSGGALVNLRGELIGINTAILSRSGGNVGIGFAIPINMANKLMRQIIRHGRVRRGLLGVHVQNLNPQLARKAFGLSSTDGALVAQVNPGTAAENAGIQPGDVIVSVNGKRIKNSRDLRNKIGLLDPDQKVTIVYIRNSRKHTVSTRLSSSGRAVATRASSYHKHLQGAKIGNIPRNSPLYGRVKGVMVFQVQQGSAAAAAGLRAGDIITKVNRRSIKNLSSFRSVVSRAGKALLLNVRRDQGALFLYLE
jgi:serine protease Do/serine protease DegQ